MHVPERTTPVATAPPNDVLAKPAVASARGFTIVELLVVIVVIAILAAITIVAYNGIQQRANNTSIIAAANNSLSVIDAYITANDAYPPLSGSSCITSTSGCVVNTVTTSARATFDTSLTTIGTLPRSIPMTGGNQTGILYDYTSGRTYNGAVQPAILFYWLYGTSQPCGLSDVVTGWTAGVPSSTGYTIANDSSTGKTLCYIHISGPSS